MAAALRAAELGADVVLVDDGPELGGALLAGERATRRASWLGARVATPGSRCSPRRRRSGSSTGSSPCGRGSTLHQIRADRARRGHRLDRAAADVRGQRPARGDARARAPSGWPALYGVAPGKVAVVATTGDRGVESALALSEAGVSSRRRSPTRAAGGPGRGARRDAWTRARDPAAAPARGVVRAFGRGERQGRGASPSSTPMASWIADTESGIDCDLSPSRAAPCRPPRCCSRRGRRPAGTRPPAPTCPTALPPGIHAAGRRRRPRLDRTRPRRRARSRAPRRRSALGLGDEADRARLRRRARGAERGAPSPSTEPVPAAASGAARRPRQVLRLPVRGRDHRRHLDYAIDEGFDSLELLKRYTTVTMGPCQGRMCQLASIRQVSARHRRRRSAEVGLTTARPPWSTVPMGVLAGRPFEPAKRSAVHGRHRELGGNVLWAGDWRRPYDYGDAEAETMAVHESAGLIDVSTLGKLMVRGPEAGAFLNLPLPEPLRHPEAGTDPLRGARRRRRPDHRRRHRLPPRRRLVLRHHDLERRRRGRELVRLVAGRMGLDVHLTDVSQGLAAFNLAGPDSREILSGLTELDCSNDAFTYLDGKRAQVAGVPCLLLRIGFVGELGYELHCPAALAEHLWDAILEAGAAARDPAVRPRAPAGAAPAEAPHPRRPGHRRRVEPARGGDAVDRQARQGGGLHRPLGARGGQGARRREHARRVHDRQRRGARPRAPRWSPANSRSGG